jgi:hypothetical protein
MYDRLLALVGGAGEPAAALNEAPSTTEDETVDG